MPHEHPLAGDALAGGDRPVKKDAEKAHPEDSDEHPQDVSHPPGVHDEPAEASVGREAFRQKENGHGGARRNFQRREKRRQGRREPHVSHELL